MLQIRIMACKRSQVMNDESWIAHESRRMQLTRLKDDLQAIILSAAGDVGVSIGRRQ
jgi:hypothetical protein